MSSDREFMSPSRPRRGTALVLAIIGLFIVALLATVTIRMVSGESLVTENMQSGTAATYVADQALSNFYAGFQAADPLNQPVVSEVDKPDDENDNEDMFYFTDYSANDLLSSDITHDARTVARITPTKLLSSESGDVYMIDATIMAEDSRQNRPVTARTMRTYATLAPIMSLEAALTAPGGLYAYGKKDYPDRLHLKGLKADKKGRQDKCGVGSDVPALATPAGAFNIYDKNLIKSVKLEPNKSEAHDESAESYEEQLATLETDWSKLMAASYTRTLTPAEFAALNWSSFDRRRVWPSIRVNGTVTITNGYQGFGLLVVTEDLRVQGGALKWDGVIATGKKLTVVNGTGSGSTRDAHTHIKGAVAAGLNCTNSTAAQCRVEFGNPSNIDLRAEHLGVDYSGCNVRAAMARHTTIRPFTSTRHFTLY
jgi:hypothetical protein